jgi:hypothetical protein
MNALQSHKEEERRPASETPKLNVIVMVIEIDVLGSLSVAPDKLFVARRPFVLAVARQHALDAHAHALDVLHGAPALRAEKVETYDAIGVDVWMHGNWSVVLLDKGDFWWFCSTWCQYSPSPLRAHHGTQMFGMGRTYRWDTTC